MSTISGAVTNVLPMKSRTFAIVTGSDAKL